LCNTWFIFVKDYAVVLAAFIFGGNKAIATLDMLLLCFFANSKYNTENINQE
jgi:hypothetical protein